MSYETVVNFVEGTLRPAEFAEQLYRNKALEFELSETVSIPPYTKAGTTLYDYLIGLDLNKPSHLLNAQDSLAKFLQIKGIKHESTPTFLATYDVLLKAQPKWLDMPDSYSSILLGEAGTLSGKALLAWLKEAIDKRFRFMNKPPKWLQSPQWPIQNNEPLLFVGQLNFSTEAHDDAQLFVFFDPKTKSYANILQSM